MKRGWYILLWVLMAVGVLLLTGCAAPTPMPTATVPISTPCKAALEAIPDRPAEYLNLDASRPGTALKAVEANRQAWIGYGDALRPKLEACK